MNSINIIITARRPALLWRFVILAPDRNCKTYLITYLEAGDLRLNMEMILRQMTNYLNVCAQQQTPDSCLTFWSQQERDLHQLVMFVLSLPTTNAVVQRVYSAMAASS